MTLFEPSELDHDAAPEGPRRRVRLTVAYHGGGFHGFAANPGVKTVGGTLAAALEKVLGHPVRLTCAGRTDAGVHGWGQVVTFDARGDAVDVEKLVRSVNRMCAPAVAVRDGAVVDDLFDARFSARWRSYRYTVLNRAEPDPFLADRAWHVPEPLDLRAMRLACDPLIGEHDFTSLCREPKGVPSFSMVRTILDAGWVDLGDGVLRFDVRATSFCQQMVRATVGLLVDVGRGKRRAGEVAGVLRARDRAAAGNVAPAHGLVLWEVGY